MLHRLISLLLIVSLIFTQTAQASALARLPQHPIQHRTETTRTDAIGSSISGDTIAIQSGNDLNLTGSRAVAEGDITLAAMNDINISAATNLKINGKINEENQWGQTRLI